MTPLSVIIVGAPRSGTYWLVDLLQTRFGVHFPSETHFVPLYARYLWLFGDLSVPDNRRRLLESIYEFLQIWTARSSSSREYLVRIRRLSLLVTLDEGCAQDIVAESSDYPSLVEALYRHFVRIHGADASGDKSAHYRVLEPESVFGYFPEAKMLHVIRDGRDVATSWMQQWFGPASIRDAARLWRDHVQVNRAWGRRNASRYLEIRYEDLATDIEDQIGKLESFLGKDARPHDPDGAQSDLARALANTESHSAMLDINAAENISKWRKDMPETDVKTFEGIAGQALAEFGYDVSLRGNKREQFVLPRPSVHLLRVALKSLLPLVLGVSSRLGLPILRIINRRYPEEWRQVSVSMLGRADP